MSSVSLFKCQLSTFRKSSCRYKYVRPVLPKLQAAGFLETTYNFFQDATSSSTPGLLPGLLINSAVYLTGIQVLKKGLTTQGIIHSWVLGTTVYSAFGLGAYFLVCLYFVVGTAVTKVKLEQKQKEGIAESRSGKRDIGSVWGSGFAGMVCALLGLITGQFEFFRIGYVASIGSKLADTISSEIGKAYGEKTYLISTFQQVPRGTEGGVGVEGTLAGVAGAIFYSVTALVVGQLDSKGVGICVVACTLANIFESYVGATIQNKFSWLTNDLVNIMQISVAATLAIVLQQLL
eukprot:TRINITY_DN6418_c0_g2_i1.p1 TRINITY_DN6418_c0_g2~~TRINITY_DN6418_c0_g2_i1.p1  ORF type:complete len:291 (+),score=18.92 TRINITY_DN6418_c0_g2_i1:231-1103(+)